MSQGPMSHVQSKKWSCRPVVLGVKSHKSDCSLLNLLQSHCYMLSLKLFQRDDLVPYDEDAFHNGSLSLINPIYAV